MTVVSKSSAFPKSVQPGIPALGPKPAGWLRGPLSAHLFEKQRPIHMTDDAEYRLVTVKRSRGGVVTRENLKGREISVKSQFLLHPGDFLISKRQIVHGACGIVPAELEGSIASNEYAILRGKPTVDLEFLNYLAHSIYFQQTCFHSSIGVHVEKMIFKLDRWLSWDFDLPPLPEQRKIAEILSTWDAAISAQERLIANARAQKKALMQILLPTGAHPPKKRLPGFSGEWREIKLRELGRCYNGVTYAPADVVDGKNGLLILRSSNVQNGRLDFADTVFVKPGVKTSCLTREGDILICVRNGSRNLIGKTARITSDATGHAHGAFMSLFRSTEPDFAYHLFKSHTYDQQVKRNLGATINSINTSDLHNFRFMVPPKPERARIAEILSANDREIEHHEKLLLGTCAQKSALMQQLLTGKRRVKIEAVANA